MKFSVAVAAAALLAGAQAHSNVTYTTEIVSSYVTYCPEPTKITHGGVTYTVTKPTTLTITNCPCTVTKPILTTTISKCHDCVKPTSAPYNNATTAVVPPVTSTVLPTGTISKPPPFTGAAARAAPGAGLAAILGFAAYVL
jgi:hypothetical protein